METNITEFDKLEKLFDLKLNYKAIGDIDYKTLYNKTYHLESVSPNTDLTKIANVIYKDLCEVLRKNEHIDFFNLMNTKRELNPFGADFCSYNAVEIAESMACTMLFDNADNLSFIFKNFKRFCNNNLFSYYYNINKDIISSYNPDDNEYAITLTQNSLEQYSETCYRNISICYDLYHLYAHTVYAILGAAMILDLIISTIEKYRLKPHQLNNDLNDIRNIRRLRWKIINNNGKFNFDVTEYQFVTIIENNFIIDSFLNNYECENKKDLALIKSVLFNMMIKGDS
jgi:hypothetical protein